VMNCGSGICGVDCNPGYIFRSDRGCMDVCEYTGGVRMSNGTCALACTDSSHCRGCAGFCNSNFPEGSFCERGFSGSCTSHADCQIGFLCSSNSRVCLGACAPSQFQQLDCSPPPAD
jgi:hypothetical protein